MQWTPLNRITLGQNNLILLSGWLLSGFHRKKTHTRFMLKIKYFKPVRVVCVRGAVRNFDRCLAVARRGNSEDGHLSDTCDTSHSSILRTSSVGSSLFSYCRLARARPKCPCATARFRIIMILYIWRICKFNQASLCARQKRRQPISLMPVTDPAVSSECSQRTKRFISAYVSHTQAGSCPRRHITHPTFV